MNHNPWSRDMEIGSSGWKEIIRTGAVSSGINGVDECMVDRFIRYGLELLQWNRRINLTTITDARGVAVKHFLDSIAAAALIPAGAFLLDIGSGAGFPGIPLKIVRPDLRITLVDSVRKKVNFQKHIIRILGLEAIEARQVRVEEFESEKYFDVIVSRALSSLTGFVSLALPFLAPDGVILAWKGRRIETQTEVTDLLSGENKKRLTVSLSTYRLSDLETERTLVTVRRISV